MKRKLLAFGCVAVLVTGCTKTQIAASLWGSYDTAVSAEIVYLSTGQASDATKKALGACRKKAFDAVDAVAKIEAAGGSAEASVTNVATAAIAGLTAAVTDAKTGAVKQPCASL